MNEIDDIGHLTDESKAWIKQNQSYAAEGAGDEIAALDKGASETGGPCYDGNGVQFREEGGSNKR
jgi:hypothetical protein